MFLVLPSDPTTEKASHYLTEQGVKHTLMPIPESLGYKTTANVGLYIEHDQPKSVMMDMSAQGFVIMRVFQDFVLEASEAE